MKILKRNIFEWTLFFFLFFPSFHDTQKPKNHLQFRSELHAHNLPLFCQFWIQEITRLLSILKITHSISSILIFLLTRQKARKKYLILFYNSHIKINTLFSLFSLMRKKGFLFFRKFSPRDSRSLLRAGNCIPQPRFPPRAHSTYLAAPIKRSSEENSFLPSFLFWASLPKSSKRERFCNTFAQFFFSPFYRQGGSQKKRT